MFDIPYIKLHFYTELMADTVMPETKVAALRGGMGEMLLRQNCIADKNCHKCHFYESCIVQHTFYSVMEKKPAYVTGDESVGYLIECMDRRTKYKKGSRFEFFLTLFGESIVFFNSYLQAFHQLGMAGIGKHHSRFRICEIRNTEGELLVLGSQVDMSRYVIHTISDYILYRKETLLNMNGKWTLTFQTPLSMKHRRYFMQEFYSEALVKGAARRIQMLNYYTGTESTFPEFAEYYREIADLRENPKELIGMFGRTLAEMDRDEYFGMMEQLREDVKNLSEQTQRLKKEKESLEWEKLSAEKANRSLADEKQNLEEQIGRLLEQRKRMTGRL